MYLAFTICFAGALVVSLLLIPLLKALALRHGWVDRPDAVRKHHTKVTPYLGGVAIAAGFATGIGAMIAYGGPVSEALASKHVFLWIGAVVIFLTGLYDDIRGLGFKRKFVVQLAVAYALLHAGYRIDLTGFPFAPADGFDHALFSIPLTLLWIVGVMNAMNLIDGMDGLAGGVALIAFACLAVIFGINGQVVLVAIAVAMCGALVAFLRHNFHPASIFMGDAGSLFLGYMLATFALEGRTHADPWLALIVPVFALALPLVDTGFSIVRRLLQRRAIFAPDADHIHHRLKRRFSVRWATITLYMASLVFGVGAIFIAVSEANAGTYLAIALACFVPFGLVLLGYDLRFVRQVELGEQHALVTGDSSPSFDPTGAQVSLAAERVHLPHPERVELRTGPFAVETRQN